VLLPCSPANSKAMCREWSSVPFDCVVTGINYADEWMISFIVHRITMLLPREYIVPDMKWQTKWDCLLSREYRTVLSFVETNYFPGTLSHTPWRDAVGTSSGNYH
jgi:hypothetical protein